VQSTDSATLFFPDCASPGRVENSLRLAKTSDSPPRLRLSWEPSCLPGYSDYGLFVGRLGEWTSHRAVTCTDHGSDLEEFMDSWDGDEFFLVVPHNGRVEGSYGIRSDGTERPRPADPPSDACASVQEVDDCSPF
jgi:hypothetical protein